MPNFIKCVEHVTRTLPEKALHPEIGRAMVVTYGSQVDVRPPDLLTAEWRITPRSYAGYLPLPQGYVLYIEPKVPLTNLFGMLDYAISTQFSVYAGTFNAGSLQEFFEQLASVLAKRVLARARRGFHRAYVWQEEQLPYVRGRLQVAPMLRAPWKVRLDCHYDEHTGDIQDNHILAWTLHTIARTGLCGEDVSQNVRAAFRSLQGLAPLTPVSAKNCENRLYHRLNVDYQPLHGLCRFFLQHTGPTHLEGAGTALPFLINMAQLFEGFVAQWLLQHLPATYKLRIQECVHLPGTGLNYDIDLVIYATETDTPLCVLDTKYKQPEAPSHADINQMVTYARLKQCKMAVLLYPTPLPVPFKAQVADTGIYAMAFDIAGDLEAAGLLLLSELIPLIGQERDG